MNTKFVILTLAMALAVAGPVFAMDDAMQEGAAVEDSIIADLTMEKDDVMEEETPEVVRFGNKFCPISGEEIGTMGQGVEVEYNGKIYMLCCPMCKKDFLADPEKYIEMMSEKMEDTE